MKFKKLMLLLEEEDWYEEKARLSENQKKRLFQELQHFYENDKFVYREGDLNKLSTKLKAIAEYAQRYLNEKNTSFDNITINRNMREMKKYLNKFEKTASKVQENQERLTALYEDIALILDRYFDLGEEEKGEEDENDEQQQINIEKY